MPSCVFLHFVSSRVSPVGWPFHRSLSVGNKQAQCIAAVALGVDCNVHPQGLLTLGALKIPELGTHTLYSHPTSRVSWKASAWLWHFHAFSTYTEDPGLGWIAIEEGPVLELRQLCRWLHPRTAVMGTFGQVVFDTATDNPRQHPSLDFLTAWNHC